MTKYNVHLYREMRLTFVDIEADTPTDAAAIARDRPTDDADNIEDCDGENYAALVDLAGTDDFGDSVTIDFEPERLRKAAVALSAALKAILPYAENEHASLLECGKRDGDPSIEAEAEACGHAINRAATAIAATEVTGVTPEADIHALSIADIWDIWPIQAVQENRPDLSDEQAWNVLQSARRNHDATIGINWDVLEYHADMLFGPAPETDETAEA